VEHKGHRFGLKGNLSAGDLVYLVNIQHGDWLMIVSTITRLKRQIQDLAYHLPEQAGSSFGWHAGTEELQPTVML
jgi:hypothetical protein